MRVIWLIAGLNRRMMKILLALALIAYIACKYMCLGHTAPVHITTGVVGGGGAGKHTLDHLL